MKLPFKQKRLPVLFLSSAIKHSVDHKVNLLLSPEFYWSRVFKIPTKYTYEAKKYLPSLFASIVPNGVNYHYKILKLEDNKFICIAYSLERIIQGIKNSGLTHSNVNKIFFSQFELNYKTSIKIDDRCGLEKVDNIVLKVPNKYLEESIDINNVLENISLSGASISIGYYSNILDTKSYSFITAILIVIFMANLFNFTKKYADLKSIKQDVIQIKSSYKLPATMLQTKAKLNKMYKIDSEQKSMRDAMFYIFRYNKSKNPKEYFSDFYMNKKLVRLELKNIRQDGIKKYLDKRFDGISISKNSNTTRINFRL